MTDDPAPALLLVAHGTRDPGAGAEMAELVELVSGRLGVPVAGGWLEDFADPDPLTAGGALLDAGARTLVTLPLLLLGAGHAKTDVPAHVAALRAARPAADVRHGTVLGLHPALFALAGARVAAARDAAGPPGEDEALLVTGSGSSDPDANGDLAKAARFLAEGTGHRWVEVAYAGVTWPRADAALRRLHAAGARRVVRFSWSLLAGVLERRVTGMAEDVASETGLAIADAGRFGPHPLLAEAVAERYHQALGGHASANCDLCQYRLPLPGRERLAGAPSAGGTGARVHPAAPGQ